MPRFYSALALCLALALYFIPGSLRPAFAAAPLPAATLQVDPASRAYLLEIADHIVTITDSLGSIGELFSNPDIGNDEWKIKIIANLVFIRHAHEELSKIEPPSRLVDAHATLLVATSQCNDATYNVADGIDNLDGDLLKLAAQQVFECGQKITSIPDMLTVALSAAVPSATSTSTPSSTPTSIKTPVASSATANTVIATRDANLRAGPGTTYKVVGTVKTGQELKVIGKNPKGDWLQVDAKTWISASLVKPSASPTPSPTSTPTVTPLPTATIKPPVADAPCSCDQSADRNCADFVTQPDAQACFDYCSSQGMGDLHLLDPDKDLLACELLPSK